VDNDILRTEVESNPAQTTQELADKLGYSFKKNRQDHNLKKKYHLNQIGKTIKREQWIPHEIKGVRKRICVN